jgi:hypothetical protein
VGIEGEGDKVNNKYKKRSVKERKKRGECMERNVDCLL